MKLNHNLSLLHQMTNIWRNNATIISYCAIVFEYAIMTFVYEVTFLQIYILNILYYKKMLQEYVMLQKDMSQKDMSQKEIIF